MAWNRPVRLCRGLAASCAVRSMQDASICMPHGAVLLSQTPEGPQAVLLRKKKRAVHPVSTCIPWLTRTASSSQATLRHPESTPYRCFLPDLAGFEGFRRAGPSFRRRLPEAVPRNHRPQEGIQSRYSGLRVQGTASSPFSTTRPDVIRRLSECQIKRRRGWDSNPRRIAPHTISNRAESAALAPLRVAAWRIIASAREIAKTFGLIFARVWGKMGR